MKESFLQRLGANGKPKCLINPHKKLERLKLKYADFFVTSVPQKCKFNGSRCYCLFVSADF